MSKHIEDYNKVLPIVEIYTAVQSEGSRAGYPTVVIRTTGCTHRCFFGQGGWCDSWYTSIHPEKGSYCFQDIIDIYDKNPHIEEMMITGGSPTMHMSLLNELTEFASKRGIVTTIETEGSHVIDLERPIDLLSISPKFSNSVPVLGETTPQGKVVDEKMVKQHNKFRLNVDTIAQSINNNSNYHIKPVWDGEDEKVLTEILHFIKDLTKRLHEIGYKAYGWKSDIDFIELEVREKVYFMPAGDSREALFASYPKVFDWVRDNGFKMTWRPHIIAFEDKREV